MTRTLIVVAAFLSLAVPAALAAPPADKGKPDSPGNSAAAPGQSAEQNAAKKCKQLRGTTTDSIAAFKALYGTNKNKANAFGKCVSAMAKKLEAQAGAQEEAEAKENAAKACKKLRGTDAQSIAAFKEKYGTNKNKANAFGKCVSQAREGQEHVVS